MHDRKLRIQILLVMNFGAALWLWDPSPPAHAVKRFALTEAGAQAARGASGPSDKAAAELPTFHPLENRRYVYQFDRNISIHGLTSQVPPIVFHGKLSIDVFHADSRGFDALAEEEVSEALATGGARFRMHLDSDGGGLTLSGEEPKDTTSREHAAILKDLIANWNFASRTDTVGRYSVSFARIADRGQDPRFTKRKLAYVDAREPIPTIAQSLHIMEWAPELGMPRVLKGAESTQLGTGNLGLASESRYSVRYVSMEPSRVDGVRLAGLVRTDTLSLDRNTDPKERGLNRPIPTWANLFHRIEGLTALSSPDQLALFGDVVASLRANASGLGNLLAMLSPTVVQAGASSALFKLAVGALATAASPAAQAALVTLYQDPNCPVDGKGTILAAMTTTQASLNSDTREFLVAESQGAANQDLANGAAFALGSALQNAPNDRTTAQAIAQIQNAWSTESAAGSKFQEAALLDVMGNSGREEFLPILSNLIASDSTDLTLRSKAVYSLRFIQSSDAISMLEQQLGDSLPDMRLAAASAMFVAPWNAGFSKPLTQCVSSESDPAILKACRQALSRATSE